MTGGRQADVCLVLEGTYPYVTGGVSNWTHDLIRAQHHLAFHLVALAPPGPEGPMRFELPPNVIGVTRVELQALPAGDGRARGLAPILSVLEESLIRMMDDGGLDDVAAILDGLRRLGPAAGRASLLDSRAAWDLLRRMYERQCPRVSFLEYFWTWRTILSGLCSVLLAPLPPARVYHALCTGYAGLYAARAALETTRPALLTEHGIYTNERRIEITMADWLERDAARSLSIERMHRDLRDLWIDTFTSYSRATYAACSRIITLYEGNTELQVQDGADPARITVIPNGIAVADRPPAERARTAPPTVALIGRVVPIKDVKTFLRAAAILREFVPDVRVWVLGPLDEDPDYVAECRQLLARLDLDQTVEFKGRVVLDDYYPQIDVLVLTSVSEAQPLVILEGAAAGVPSVATDVGACREMILGRSDETPPLGEAGAVTPLASPAATADAVRRLLTDGALYRRCREAARARVRASYDKGQLDRAYAALYETHMARLPAPVGA